MTDLSRELNKQVADATPHQAPPFDVVISQRERRRRRRQAGWTSAVVVVVLAAAVVVGNQLGSSGNGPQPAAGPTVSNETDGPGPSADPTEPVPPRTPAGRPPPIQLMVGGETVNVEPSSFCWTSPPDANGTASGTCADGWTPDQDLTDAGRPEAVDFWFFADGDWKFQATFSELGEKCPRRITVPVERTGEHAFAIAPAGLAGDYRVDLFGRGSGNDVSASFKWTTPVDGTFVQPDAYMGLVSDAGGDLNTYGLELSISDLSAQPETAQAEVTVTAANGRSMSIDANRQDGGCHAEGSAYFTGSDAQSRQVLDLGPAPYTYAVTLTLDDATYLGQGVWPTDERRSATPYVTLTFDPPLPAFTGD
jgi:hypothetical protein